MKSNEINWRLVWQIGIPLCLSIFVYCFWDIMKHRLSKDEITAEEYVGLYFETPTSKMHNLKAAWITAHPVPSRPDLGPSGCIYFDCDQTPLLKNFDQYKRGGDLLEVTHNFIKWFDKDAASLLPAKDIECFYMRPFNECRCLVHNKKTNRYFFIR